MPTPTPPHPNPKTTTTIYYLLTLLIPLLLKTALHLYAKKPPPTDYQIERITNMLPLSASTLGPSRAPTPFQPKNGSRRQYILQNKTEEDISRELKMSNGPKMVKDVAHILQSHSLDIANPDDTDLYTLARTIRELSTQSPGVWASYCEILRAISFLIKKIADDNLQENSSPSGGNQPEQQQEIINHVRQLDDRMSHQEDKISTLTDITEKIMELVQKINDNAELTTRPALQQPPRPPPYETNLRRHGPLHHTDQTPRDDNTVRKQN